jgi:hypothetical protein
MTRTIRYNRITEYVNFSPALLRVSTISATRRRYSTVPEKRAKSHVIFFQVDSDARDL